METREKRIVFEYTQSTLAEEIGMTPSFLGQIERGDALPGLDMQDHLTQLLAIDANDYFYDKNDNSQESREFYFMIEQMTPEMRKLSFDIIRRIYKIGR